MFIVSALVLVQCGRAKVILRLIHGINEECAGRGDYLKKYFLGYDTACLESGRGDAGVSLQQEVDRVCKELTDDASDLTQGFTLFGMSQGALIGRIIIETCPIGKYVRRFLSMGGPHQGVALIPSLKPDNPLQQVLPLCQLKFLQDLIGACGYIRDLNLPNSDSVDNILRRTNNELAYHEEYKERLAGLDIFMAIAHRQDEVVRPYNSAIWGYYKDGQYKDYVPFEETRQYKEDLLGLKKLNQEGKLYRCVLEHGHLQIDDHYMKVLIQSFADWTKHEYKAYSEELRKVCQFEERVRGLEI